jgi:hypothetical protein
MVVAVIFVLLGVPALLALVGLVAGIILSSIALRMAGRDEQAGARTLALTTLIVCSITVVILIIVGVVFFTS